MAVYSFTVPQKLPATVEQVWRFIATYIPPLGILGRMANTLFIRRQLQRIFLYREKKLEQIFGKFPDA